MYDEVDNRRRVVQASTKKNEQSVKGWMVKDWILLSLKESHGNFLTATKGEQFKPFLTDSPCVRVSQSAFRTMHYPKDGVKICIWFSAIKEKYVIWIWFFYSRVLWLNAREGRRYVNDWSAWSRMLMCNFMTYAREPWRQKWTLMTRHQSWITNMSYELW